MRLTLLLLFLSSFCNAQLPVITVKSGRQSATVVLQQTSTPNLNAYAINRTDVVLEFGFTDNTGLTFTLEEATSSDFVSGLVDLSSAGYNGTDGSFTRTGRTPGTTYYYRVKASQSGYSDSDYSIDNATPISITPLFWAEVTGMKNNTDNDYGTVNASAQVTRIKSIINTSSYADWDATVAGGLRVQPPDYAYITMLNQQRRYVLNTPLTSIGDFTICFRGIITAYGYFVYHDTSNYINFTSSTSVQVRIAGTTYTITIPTTSLNVINNIVIQRSGTTLRYSVNGSSFATQSAVNTAWSITNLFGTTSGNGIYELERLVIDDIAMSTDQINQVFNYLKSNTSEPEEIDYNTIPKVNSYLDGSFVNGYVDYELNSVSNGSFSRKNVWSIGDYHHILTTKQSSLSDTQTQYLITYDEGGDRVSTPLLLPYYISNSDVHNNGSLFQYSNSLMILQSDVHYDQAAVTNLKIRRFSKDFDLRRYTDWTLSKSVPSTVKNKEQYQIPFILNDGIQLLTQEYNGSGGRYIVQARSTDYGRSWTKKRIADAGSPEWLYPSGPYNGDDGEVYYIFLSYRSGVEIEYGGIFFVRTTDGVNFKNFSGSFTKTVNTSADAITLTELFTNYAIYDARALPAESTSFEQAFVTPSGFFYTIIGNGSDTGYKIVYGTIGSSLTIKDLGTDGKTIVTNHKSEMGTVVNSFNRGYPIMIYRGGTTFDVYAFEINSGNWRIIKLTSTDMGDNWSFAGNITTDDSHQHIHMRVSENYHYNPSGGILTATKGLSSTTGNLFIYKLP